MARLTQDQINQNTTNAVIVMAKALRNTLIRQESMFKQLADPKNADLTGLDLNTVNILVTQLETLRAKL